MHIRGSHYITIYDTVLPGPDTPLVMVRVLKDTKSNY